MNVDSEKLKVILPLIVLFIEGLISYWLIKIFGIYAFPIILIMAGIPLFLIKIINVSTEKSTPL